jgi:UDP-N-acetylglucosamine 1-carboxyvinyltransferase
LIELLKEINVKITHVDKHTCKFKADEVDVEYLSSEAFHKKVADYAVQ